MLISPFCPCIVSKKEEALSVFRVIMLVFVTVGKSECLEVKASCYHSMTTDRNIQNACLADKNKQRISRKNSWQFYDNWEIEHVYAPMAKYLSAHKQGPALWCYCAEMKGGREGFAILLLSSCVLPLVPDSATFTSVYE